MASTKDWPIQPQDEKEAIMQLTDTVAAVVDQLKEINKSLQMLQTAVRQSRSSHL